MDHTQTRKNKLLPNPMGTGLRGTKGSLGACDASKRLVQARISFLGGHPCQNHNNTNSLAEHPCHNGINRKWHRGCLRTVSLSIHSRTLATSAPPANIHAGTPSILGRRSFMASPVHVLAARQGLPGFAAVLSASAAVRDARIGKLGCSPDTFLNPANNTKWFFD